MANRIVLSGGLGNQIFQYVAARVIFNQTNIVLDYSLLNPTLLKNGLPELSELALHEDVIWDCPKRLPTTRKTAELILKASSIRFDNSLRRRALIKIFPFLNHIWGLLIFKGSKVVVPRGIGASEVFPSRSRPNLLIGNFHSFKWFEANPSQFKGELSLKKGSEKIEPYKLSAAKGSPLIIQMRFGDFLAIPELNVTTPEYFRSSLSLCRTLMPKSEIWIFSNDYEKAREYLEVGYTNEYVEVNPINFSSAEILELLKLGSGYIISNSTFGWWGAYLSYQEEKQVFVPSNWYATMIPPRELLPENWQKIPTVDTSES